MHPGILLIGVVLIVLGVIQLASPATTWKVDKAFHEMNGVEPRRSDLWDTNRIIRGSITLVFGVLAIWAAFAII